MPPPQLVSKGATQKGSQPSLRAWQSMMTCLVAARHVSACKTHKGAQKLNLQVFWMVTISMEWLQYQKIDCKKVYFAPLGAGNCSSFCTYPCPID